VSLGVPFHDDQFLAQTTRSILAAAFTPEGVERHHLATPYADDYHHYYIWWLLQVALGYLYTGDTSLDSQHLRRIVQTLFSVFDEADTGITHTAMYYFVTSIGEPANTDPGKAYSFYHGTNLLFALRQFEHLADARGDRASAKYFRERTERLREQLQRFRSADGFYIRPLEPGFRRVSIRPAFPDDWAFAQIDTTVSGTRVCYTMTATPDRLVYDFRGSSAVEASLCLPLPNGWSGGQVEANVPGVVRTMTGEPRPCFETRLTLGETVVEVHLSN